VNAIRVDAQGDRVAGVWRVVRIEDRDELLATRGSYLAITIFFASPFTSTFPSRLMRTSITPRVVGSGPTWSGSQRFGTPAPMTRVPSSRS
jgi:hypothetical protein